MKYIIFFALNIFSVFALAQPTAESLPDVVIGPYKWGIPINLDEVSRDGQLLVTDAVTSVKGQLFDIVKFDGDDVILIITNYENENSPEAMSYNFRSDAGGTFLRDSNGKKEQRYFRTSKEKIQRYALRNSIIRESLSFGLVNFPFKYRLLKRNGNFSGAFNFGAAVGWTAPKRAFRDGSFSIITGYSISNIVLEGADVRRSAVDLEKSNNYSAFSFSVGPMFELSTVQVIISAGFDFLNRNNQKAFGWLDQGKPWLSVGIGYAIFTKQGKEKISDEKNK